MSSDTMPTVALDYLGKLVAERKFLAVLSRGDASWDALWGGANPPVPPLGATNVIQAFGYLRPTVVDYLVPDDAGLIVALGGARFTLSNAPTRYVRVRISMPAGSYVGEVLREIGLFFDPTIAAGVPPGQTVLGAADVTARGTLCVVRWRERLTFEDGTTFGTSFVVKI